MRALILALLLLLPSSAYALSYPKPDGVPTAYLPDYTTTVGVWAINVAGIGDMTCILNLHNDSQWYLENLVTMCTTSWQTGYEEQIKAAGSLQVYMAGTLLPQINQVLWNNFPPFGSAPPPVVTARQQINQALGTYVLKVGPNGATLSLR